MDAAVGLVEVYLLANGYLTATEYPIVEALAAGGYRTVTDIDVLAIRLPGAGRIVPVEGSDPSQEQRLFGPDPLLADDDADERLDFIIAEVKEGTAELNRGARSEKALITAIRRFAFMEPGVAARVAHDLIAKGHAIVKEHHLRVRLFAFGSRKGDDARPPYRVVLFEQILDYLVSVGRDHSAMRLAASMKNPTMNLLTILGKAGYLGPRRGGGAR